MLWRWKTMSFKVGDYFREDNDFNANNVWDQSLGKMKVYEGMQIGGIKRGAIPQQNKKIAYKDFVNVEAIVKAGTRTTVSDEWASGTNHSATSGNMPIVPLIVQPGIEDTIMLDHPFYAMVQKRAHRSKYVDWNKRTARGAAAFKYEDPSMEPVKDTLSRSVIEIKSAYSVRRITNFDIRASEFYINWLNEEVNSATEALLELLEGAMISGDASTNAYEYSGLDVLITTNTETQSTAELTLDKIAELVRWAKQGAKASHSGTGRPNLHLTNTVDYDKVKALIRPWLKYNDTNALNWGIESYSIEGRPVITSPKCSITTGSRRWYVLDMSKWFVAMLQDITYTELPVDGDAKKFMLKTYQALTCLDETKNAMAYGIGA